MTSIQTLLANEYFKQGIKFNAKKLLFNPYGGSFHTYFIRGEVIYGYDDL